jgi:hypothetical protein
MIGKGVLQKTYEGGQICVKFFRERFQVPGFGFQENLCFYQNLEPDP